MPHVRVRRMVQLKQLFSLALIGCALSAPMSHAIAAKKESKKQVAASASAPTKKAAASKSAAPKKTVAEKAPAKGKSRVAAAEPKGKNDKKLAKAERQSTRLMARSAAAPVRAVAVAPTFLKSFFDNQVLRNAPPATRQRLQAAGVTLAPFLG